LDVAKEAISKEIVHNKEEEGVEEDHQAVQYQDPDLEQDTAEKIIIIKEAESPRGNSIIIDEKRQNLNLLLDQHQEAERAAAEIDIDEAAAHLNSRDRRKIDLIALVLMVMLQRAEVHQEENSIKMADLIVDRKAVSRCNRRRELLPDHFKRLKILMKN